MYKFTFVFQADLIISDGLCGQECLPDFVVTGIPLYVSFLQIVTRRASVFRAKGCSLAIKYYAFFSAPEGMAGPRAW